MALDWDDVEDLIDRVRDLELRIELAERKITAFEEHGDIEVDVQERWEFNTIGESAEKVYYIRILKNGEEIARDYVTGSERESPGGLPRG